MFPSHSTVAAPLRADVRLLGELLGRVLRQHAAPGVFEEVEQVRQLAIRAADDDELFETLGARLAGLSIESAPQIARAFAHFLALANVAGQHHRSRRRREHARDPHEEPQRGSFDQALAALLQDGVHGDTLADTLSSAHIELVLTAHPTEISRRTVLQARSRMADWLAMRDRADLTPVEEQEVADALEREIALAWQTDEVRRERVSPLDEVRAGLVVFEETLWDAVPACLRAADRALRRLTDRPLPIGVAPIRFGSWIGGDRDGNPNITPEVTRQATWLARWMAADLYLRDVAALRSELALTTATPELRERTAGAREPYRVLLRTIRDRLIATRTWAAQSLSRTSEWSGDVAPFAEVDELRELLFLCYDSLLNTGNELVASGRLTDTLRRVATFGLTLAPLDIRQEAARHAAAVTWIANVAHWGNYADADETTRQRMLLEQLHARRVSLADLPVAEAEAAVKDTIETFRMAAKLRPDSLGAYVITMAAVPSDVLAVELLQAIAGNDRPQRVVPLFETAADLARAGDVVRDLLAMEWYRRRIGGRQEVMVGYSDSAKDAGRFSASWLLYRAQEEIVAACDRAGVALTLFHGRGGSLGRGGGPTALAIAAQPAGSIRGALRMTVQGEVIHASLGTRDLAERTLEVYTTAVLEAALRRSPAPEPAWRTRVEAMAARGRSAYRAVVYEDARFVDYFRSATPVGELGMINIGSRPARRSIGGGVEALRAIPWQFAWTQTRLMLASWLGFEDAVAGDLETDVSSLREMYARWPFFRSTVELIEMALAEAEPRIAAQYDRLASPALREIGASLRKRLARAIEAVNAITEHGTLVENNPVLRRSIDLRNPYIDPINLVQIELLRRLRQPNADPALHDAFAVTVNGIAAGMQSTG
jgi:phosphoenolpyruvate carboxylase